MNELPRVQGRFIKGRSYNKQAQFKKGQQPWNKGTKGIMIAWNKGKKHSEQTRQKISLAHKGKPRWLNGRSEADKLKISNAKKGKCFSELHKQKLSEARRKGMLEKRIIPWNTNKKRSKEWLTIHYRKGYKPSQETREKWSIIRKGRIPPNKGIPVSEKEKARLLDMRLHQVIPRKDTIIECMLQNELSFREIGFCKHYLVLGQPDIAFPNQKIAVFADGDYWHNTEKSKKRDLFVNTALQQDGWLVLRYWEHEIKANPEAAVDEILDCVWMRNNKW